MEEAKCAICKRLCSDFLSEKQEDSKILEELLKNSIAVSFLELVSKELNHLAAILHVYAGGLNFMK